MFDRTKILNAAKNSEDRLLFSLLLERAYLCQKSSQPTFGPFSDPYRAGCFFKLLGHTSGLKVCCFGGFDGAERIMPGFFPDYMEIDKALFPIDAVMISYNTKFAGKIRHRDFLGAVLSLGISRDKIGDIIIKDNAAVLLADNKISSYIIINLNRVSNTKVKCERLPLGQPIFTEENCTQKNITVSSLRLDAVLSASFGLSRTKTASLTASGKVFVNWQPEQSPSKNVKETDIITLRGEGRIKIIEVKGKTKKDRFILSIHRYC